MEEAYIAHFREENEEVIIQKPFQSTIKCQLCRKNETF